MPFHRKRLGGDVYAIFVHAGAGYHSVQNESIHLQACADAAKVAMTFLRNGGTAIDAVEAAIKVLEDKEITNAGYGSNLAIDGTVECDATLVDHYGRSGAVGALSQIANPIHLARLVLDHSSHPLSLRRVPPNLLVGQGAVDFAFECKVPILPHDFLISPAAKERWNRWNKDLKQARRQGESSQSSNRSHTPESEDHPRRPGLPPRSTHSNQLLAGLRIESQPYSPQLTPVDIPDMRIVDNGPSRYQSPSSHEPSASMVSHHQGTRIAPNNYMWNSAATPDEWSSPRSSHQGNDGQPSQHRVTSSSGSSDCDRSFIDSDPQCMTSKPQTHLSIYGENEQNWEILASDINPEPPTSKSTLPADSQLDGVCETGFLGNLPSEDNITDTVGAIAIDCFGRIAAGSSSGGIGMKHKGRTGPAALVNIGTSVVPIDQDDVSKTCVAAVTSGTGEHMATTSAAGLCANRLYYNQKKGKAGKSVTTDEESAIRSFVEKDFMGHPSVKNSHSAGAIGVMAVKKAADGLWLHFAHNTDSFALASMHSEEEEPSCVMSRGKGNGSITSGARSIKHYTPKNTLSTGASMMADEPMIKKQRMGKGSRGQES